MTDGLSQPLRYKRDTRGSIDVLSRTFDADSENLYREAAYHISIEVRKRRKEKGEKNPVRY